MRVHATRFFASGRRFRRDRMFLRGKPLAGPKMVLSGRGAGSYTAVGNARSVRGGGGRQVSFLPSSELAPSTEKDGVARFGFDSSRAKDATAVLFCPERCPD
jgi:hypothetical protein